MEEDINVFNYRGILLNSLRKVLEQLHPSLRAHDEALYYVENLCLRLLIGLCNDTKFVTIQDVEEKVQKTFPTPIDKWALADARDTIDKTKKKKSVLPVDKMHILLQKEVLQYKIDSSVSLFLVAVLEYISADILKLAGNYVKNMKSVEITQEDVQIAIRADCVLMDMFYQGDNANSMIVSPLPPVTPRDGLSYEEVVKELLHDEKQYLRDLHMIIRVFREELVKVVDDQHELEPIFSNIFDIYELTVTLLGSLEDVIEMSQDQKTTPYIGSCFEELAEAEEFDVYVKYANDITSNQAKDALSNLLSKPKAQSLMAAGHGFREAVKFYLPKLLLTPIGHAFVYIEYVDKLYQLSQNPEDRESFENVKGLLGSVNFKLQKQIPLLPKESLVRINSRARRHQAIEKTKELQSVVEHWEKDIGQCCNEFIREDTLMKLVSGKRNTERKVFLFDGLLVLCKPNSRKPTVSGSCYDYKLKEKFYMRRVDIIDRPDTDELKHTFEIAPREPHSVILIARNAQHKNEWMADLVMLNTKSMLERILDSILLDIERRHPLKLPNPDIYKFAVPDSASNIVLEEKESAGVPLIKGATLVKLIERLTYHIYADPMFVRTFLTTFRSFCSPQELLQLLIERFDIPDPSLVYESSGDKDLDDKLHKSSQREDWKRYKKEYVQPVQFRVLNVLRHWVDHHYYDFENYPSLLHKLILFLESIQGKYMRKWVDSVLKIVQRKTENDDRDHRQITYAFGNSPPAIEYHLQVPESEFNLLTLHPLELARQLTLFEFELYKNVKPSELVGSVWTKKDKETTSPNLLKITRHTTNFTRWIEKSIVEAENFEERVAIYTRAIEVMMVLQELNNFNGVLTIISAYGSAAVYRLKLTYDELPKMHEKSLAECRELVKDHYRKYQEKLRSINPPCVPFFGMYLTNILHIEEGNPDNLRDTDLINFSKRRKVAEITGEIQQYQNQPYCLKVDPKIRHFLENLDPFPGKDVKDIENYLYDQSLEIEPKGWPKTKVLREKNPPRKSDITLKSPGIKPGRRNTSANSSTLSNTLPFGNKHQFMNTSEGEQSPPPNLNTSDFSVFANVNIGSGPSSYFTSHSTSSNSTFISDDTISISSTLPTPSTSSSIAPEIPRRSNSIISMPSRNNNNFNTAEHNNKPLLSPRHLHSTVSPKNLDSVTENFRSMEFHNSPDPVSPSTASYTKPRCSHHQHTHHNSKIVFNEFNERSSPSYNPSSPRVTQELNETNGSLPISPHVNVHPNAHVFHHVPPVPPLPPRKKNSIETSNSQMKQAKDAPPLLPRDKSPPPLPPRLHCNHKNINNSEAWNLGELSPHMTQLETPKNSTLMLRRNSALEKNNRDSVSSSTSTRRSSSNSSNEAKNSPGIDNGKKTISPRVPDENGKNLRNSNSESGETPKLPPKPKQSDRTMFQY